MGFYTDEILPRIIDVALATPPMEKLRARATAGLSGTVVEVGFGSGRNLPHLPDEVDRLLAVDPARSGPKLAAGRIQASSAEVEFIGLDGAKLDLGTSSCDGALSTWTLCTIPDVEQAISELRRVLKPGGKLHFVEHGLAPDERTQRWQHRLNGVQKTIAGGCNLNRDTVALLRAGGFEVDAEEIKIDGPGILTWNQIGTATDSAEG